MAKLSIQDALNYAYQAGFRGDSLARIVAIAMCESGLDTHGPDGINNNPYSRDRGLYQINSLYHPEVSDSAAYDPKQASVAAYAISNQGTSFKPWATFTNGCSDTKINQVKAVMSGTPVSNPVGGVGGGPKPWWTFPRIDNLGGVEPFGGFPKPDSNIQLPDNYPVVALLPGTITAIDGGNVAWGAVVTMRLDTPVTSLATHNAYLHLARSTVNVGQHVSSGQLIGYNGGSNAAGSQKVPLGFAFYNGPHYGQGSAWSLMTKANLNGGPLDPVPTLNKAAGGQLTGLSNLFGGGGGGNPVSSFFTSIVSVSTQANELVNTVPGFTGICEALDIVEQFVPFQIPDKVSQDVAGVSQPNDFQIWGFDTGIANPWAIADKAQKAISLPADSMQAFLVFTSTNAAAFFIRFLFVLAGFILLAALVVNMQSKVTEGIDPGKIAEMAMAL